MPTAQSLKAKPASLIILVVLVVVIIGSSSSSSRSCLPGARVGEGKKKTQRIHGLTVRVYNTRFESAATNVPPLLRPPAESTTVARGGTV